MIPIDCDFVKDVYIIRQKIPELAPEGLETVYLCSTFFISTYSSFELK